MLRGDASLRDWLFLNSATCQVNLQQNLLKELVVSMFGSNAKANILDIVHYLERNPCDAITDVFSLLLSAILVRVSTDCHSLFETPGGSLILFSSSPSTFSSFSHFTSSAVSLARRFKRH